MIQIKENLPKTRKTQLLFSLTFLLIAFTSCKKDLNTDIPSEEVLEFQNLSVSPDFDWKSTRSLEVKVEGVDLNGRSITNQLSIFDENGKELFSAWQEMSANTSIDLVVPSKDEYITVSYGSIRHTLLIDNNTVVFNFLDQTEDEEDDE